MSKKPKNNEGLADLRQEIAVAIEQNLEIPATPSVPVVNDEPVEALVSRLESIRERIWRLQAVFAVSLSADCALEANRYLKQFQDLAEQLKARDTNAFESLVRGHESLLLSPAMPIKQTVPLDVQRLCELRWEVNRVPAKPTPIRPVGQVPDGLGWML